MKKPTSSTIFILKAFLPYTKSNLMLSFTPNAFFNELEKMSGRNKSTLRSAYYRSLKKGYIRKNHKGEQYLTPRGRKMVQVSEPKRMGENTVLLVAFDIPENQRSKRSHMRLLLKELKFVQVQKSVWVSYFDHADLLRQECQEQNISGYVRVFEAHEVDIDLR